MGFLDSIGTVLGGFNDVKQIDTDGFDFREKRRQEEFQRQREQELVGQQNEDRAVNQIADAYAGAEDQEPDVSPLLAGIEQSKRAFMLDRARGVGRERKSALAHQKAYTDSLLLDRRGRQSLDEIDARGENAQELLTAREKIRSGQGLSPREQAMIDAADKRARMQEAGRDRRAQSGGGLGRGGRPQLRLVSDGQGGTQYRWISPGESGIAGAPTATQRETAGMAQNVDEVLGKMEEIAPDVTHGPIAGRISEAVQSQYPSGKEADFDQYIKQLVDLAYIKSGKQINKQELEMQLRGMISRSKGDLPGQVKRAKPYIENILAPYEKSGAIQSGPKVGDKKTFKNGRVGVWDGKGWKAAQ